MYRYTHTEVVVSQSSSNAIDSDRKPLQTAALCSVLSPCATRTALELILHSPQQQQHSMHAAADIVTPSQLCQLMLVLAVVDAFLFREPVRLACTRLPAPVPVL
jgi:hypothetical protein